MGLIKKVVGTLFLFVVIVVLALVIALSVSPRPFTYWLANYTPLAEEPASPKWIKEYTDQVKEYKDIIYPSAHKSNNLDIYVPKKQTTEKIPVIFWMHGGGFVTGDKAGLKDWAAMMVSKGYAVVSINYEVAPDAHYPTPVTQFSEAYSYLKKIQKKYPELDFSRIIIGGDSAGAQIAGQFIEVQTNPTLAKKMGIDAVVPAETIKASLLYCGPYDLESLAKVDSKFMRYFVKQIGWAYFGERSWESSKEAQEASVTQYVTKEFPPTFLTDGNSGSFEKHAKKLEKELQAKKVPVKSLFFASDKEIGHEYQFQLNTDEAKECFAQTIQFLNEHVK